MKTEQLIVLQTSITEQASMDQKLIIINPLTARVVGAPQMILQTFFLNSIALWD